MESPTSSSNSPAPETSSASPLFVGGVVMLVLAGLLLLCALCSAFIYVIQPLASSKASSSLEQNIFSGSVVGIGLFLGGLLAWQGWTTVRGRASVPAARVFPPVLALGLAFVGALLLGLGALALPRLAVYAFAPWHFIAAALPPLILLAYAARRVGVTSGLRALVVALGWGALGATTLAFLLEAVVGLVLVAVVIVALASSPDGRMLLRQIESQLQVAGRTGDVESLAQSLNSPAAIAGVLFYVALLVPPIEEAVKTLVVAFADPRRTRPADAVLWGMAAGAGFALVENNFNVVAADAAWALAMVVRVGATTMHVATGALIGRGWYAARAEGRWNALLIAYLVSVFFHALWNGTAVLISSSFLFQARGAPTLQTLLPVGAMAMVLIILTGLGLGWIVYSVRAARPTAAAPA